MVRAAAGSRTARFLLEGRAAPEAWRAIQSSRAVRVVEEGSPRVWRAERAEGLRPVWHVGMAQAWLPVWVEERAEGLQPASRAIRVEGLLTASRVVMVVVSRMGLTGTRAAG